WAEYGPGAVGVGWDSGLLGLAGHLSSDGTAVNPETAMAWIASPDGRLFMTLSSDAWYEANIAAGADEAAARAAADRTTAAYTATS
ncbi:MAG TPA: polyketide cyclase, partial [Actinoplanes sp.]